MQLELDDARYEWIEDWATIPDTELGRENGRTHGVATTSDGRVVVHHQADPAVLVYGPDGTLQESWGAFPGAHGLTLVVEDGTDYLWLTDQDSAEVVKATLDGERALELDPPAHPAYDDGEYVPTWVAVDERRHGGDGAVWVADGYGEDLVHRYDADGTYRDTITGEEGAGAFDCPHGIHVDSRGDEPELYVADRGNHRVQVYTPGGEFERAFGAADLTSPCAFGVDGDRLVVPELYARLAVFEDESIVGYLGDNEGVHERDDWPNVPEDAIEAGSFNSPHDAAVDSGGNIYVVEWIVGGRITKLERTDG